MTAFDEDGLLKRRKKYLETNYVWCDTHGEIHHNSIDPYHAGETECAADDHRRVFVERLKGDYPHEHEYPR